MFTVGKTKVSFIHGKTIVENKQVNTTICLIKEEKQPTFIFSVQQYYKDKYDREVAEKFVLKKALHKLYFRFPDVRKMYWDAYLNK